MLELKNVSYSVSDDSGTADILKDVSLTIEDRKFIVITGPNGGGKTTLAKAVMGIVPLTSGQILLDGEDITGLNVTEAAPVQGPQGARPAHRGRGQEPQP